MNRFSKLSVRRLVLVGGTLISTGLFIWLITRQDWLLTWRYLNHIPIWLWPVSLILIVLGMLFNAWRWYVLLNAQSVPVPAREVVKTVFAGAFASNFLPSTIGGDAFRILSLLRFTPNRTLAVASVVMDRVLNVIAYLSYLPFAWSILGYPFDLRRQLIIVLPFRSSLPKRVRGFIRRVWDQLFQAFSIWARQPRTIISALIISWFSILIVLVAVWLLAQGLGMPVNLFQVMGVSVITYLITMLPISINGYGLREVTETSLYVSLGATLEQSLSLVLITRLFMLIETLPGALWLSQILAGQKPVLMTQSQKEG
ncbi:MAG: flippase-like domain-containing protein [Anaerolineaceae bacterium]|nr:flippase-like domain-containing protein [Anaerolineaceae bacterium]